MNFILCTLPDTGAKHLFPNKTNTPKELLDYAVEIEMDVSKQALLEAFNELFDQIPAQESQEGPKECVEAASATDATDNVSLPLEGPLDAKQSLVLRDLFERRWEELPVSFKLDLTTLLFEEVRQIWPSQK